MAMHQRIEQEKKVLDLIDRLHAVVHTDGPMSMYGDPVSDETRDAIHDELIIEMKKLREM